MILTYNDVGIEVDGVFFPVENASFSTQSTTEPRRKVFSSSVSARWGHSGAKKTTLNLKGYFIPECRTLFFGKTGESAGFSINYGGMMCHNSQLESVRFNISPFSPISFEASFSVYGEVEDAPNGTLFSSPTYGTGALPYYRYQTVEDLAHGYYSSFSGFQTPECLSNPFSISMSFDFEREPRYVIGSEYPNRVALQRAEKTLTVDGDGWDQIISYAGNDVTGAVGLSPQAEAWGLGFSLSGAIPGHAYISQIGYVQMFSDLITHGKVIEQSLQTEDILRGSFTVKEVLY